MGSTSNFEYLAEPVRNVLGVSGIASPTPPQAEASPLIANGQNVLIVAPTGSGKTEAAILPLLSKLITEGHGDGISLLYITPLRALNRDMLRRLVFWCSHLNLKIDVRHGDTPTSQRNKQSASPPDLLVTTPETLQAILPGRRMREHLRSVKGVVVDELHNLIESKRGTQLCVGLERLRKVAGDFQLIGLSATIGSPQEAARFLFGDRKHHVVSVAVPKEFRYFIDYPIPGSTDDLLSREVYTTADLAARLSTINDLIDSHDSALIFVNSRTMAEMIGEKLGRMRKDVAVHHGSLPREERERVEYAFKKGELKALVCTSTLELGIDIGSVDLVIQYISPRQVTSLIQRVGRSGHSLDRRSEGMIITVSADDILESSASVHEAQAGRLEPTRPYINSLDVLTHQVAGYLMDFDAVDTKFLLEEFRKTYPYRNLNEEAFRRVVAYLEQLHKLRVDGNVLRKTRDTREYYFENLSMIPDETRYLVIDVATNQNVGILGEEFMLLKARIGLHFICKGNVWQIEKISDDHKVYVTPVDDPLAAIPGWDGEMLPVPFELAQSTGRLRRKVGEILDSSDIEKTVEFLANELPTTSAARRKVAEEIYEQKKMGAPIPSDNLVLLEGFQKYLILHGCFGETVNRTLAYVFEEILSRKGLIRIWWMDGYRILIELTEDSSELDLHTLAKQLFYIAPDEVERIYQVAVQRNFPFPNRVKTIAERFGALRRGKYISHPNLCSLPTRFENTPIYEEALQETARDLINMERTKEVIAQINGGQIHVDVFQAGETPTPIAYHMLYRYLDVPELVAPDTLVKSTVQRMKMSIYATTVELICLKCGESQGTTTIAELPEQPSCSNCGSSLLDPSFWRSHPVEMLVKKKLDHLELTDDETLELSKARRAADLVLSYGKKAVIAQAVYGIGPQTASKILAKMHDDEETFYKDLLEAKLKFISTRPFWSD